MNRLDFQKAPRKLKNSQFNYDFSSDAIKYEMTESGYKASFASEGKVIEGDERQLLADFIPTQIKKPTKKELFL